VKHEDYVRLHRLLTGVNARTIWELLSNHQSVEKLLDVVPDEFYRWVQRIVSELNNAFTEIEKVALAEFDYVPRDVSRKEQAEHIKGCTYPSILFSMLDGKNYAQAIWRMIRPEASLPFKVDEA
jgi:RNA ligase